MIIDGTDLILGRLGTVVAKKALLGEKIDIVNCEKIVVTGDKKVVLARFKQKKDMGAPLVGPYFPRLADRLVRRSIRGMLPYKRGAGKDAFTNIMCYIGVPEEFKGKKLETIKEANVSKLPNMKYVRMGDISRFLGMKI